MPIPKQKDIEVPLLEEILKAGGSARPQDLYARLAQRFGLTQAELAEKQPSGNKKFWNYVQFVRQKLVLAGEIERLPRDLWTITAKGRARVGAPTPPQPSTERVFPDTPTPAVLPSEPHPPFAPHVQPPPSYDLRQLLQSEDQRVRQEIRNRLMALSPAAFERFAGKLLESQGFSNIQVTGRVGDGGIDGHGSLQMGIITIRAAFQVKRWQQNVGRPLIDQFRGAIQGSYDQGIFITTSDFTDEAKEVAIRAGSVPIVMINGDRVVEIILEKGLGAKREPLSITKLDESFFASLGA